eukprot:evm.model.scf_1170.1 EVM.evm.TU.scf_1170.1   scf_1170:11133-14270(+)
MGRTASEPLPARPATPSRRAPLQLFAFDDRRGNREGAESDKVLAFYPPELPIDDQLGTVGLAQALVTFMTTFTDGDGRLHSLETDRHWWAVRRFEDGIWFGMVVERIWGPGRLGGGACGALLEDVYEWTRLLYGPVNRLLERDPSGTGAAASVGEAVEGWGERLVGGRGKGDKGEWESPFGVERHRVVPAVPLERGALIATQEVVGRLLTATHNSLKPVRAVLVVYDNMLLWSTMDAATTRTVFNYVTKTISNGSKPQLARRSSTLKIPSDGGSLVSCWPVTVRQGLLTFFLLIDEFAGGTGQVLNQVRGVMSGRAKQIAGAAADLLSSRNKFHVSGYRYLVVDSAMHYGTASPKKKLAHLSRKTLALLAQAQACLMDRGPDGEPPCEGAEVAARGDHGAWVYVRKGTTNSLSVALEQLPDEGLVEIGDHVGKLCDKFFPGFFDI